MGVHKAHASIFKIFVLAIQAGLQVGIGAAMSAITLAGLPGISASDPALAKLLYGAVGLPCGLLMTTATVSVLYMPVHEEDGWRFYLSSICLTITGDYAFYW